MHKGTRQLRHCLKALSVNIANRECVRIASCLCCMTTTSVCIIPLEGCTWRGDDAADARHMLQGKLEQDELHGLLADGIVV